MIVGLLVAAGAAATARVGREARWRAAYRIQNPTTPPKTMDEEGAGASSPFFPSSANTNVDGIIPANFFMTSDSCGRCHKDIYQQWNSSAHHFSSFNNQWYRKSIEYMQDVIGTRPSKWCAGCHDHAVFFNGRFDRPDQGADRARRRRRRVWPAPRATRSRTCTARWGRATSRSNIRRCTISPPARTRMLRTAHDALLYLAPEPHRKTFLKPFHREQTAEFCSACHKVHLDVPVNSYRWFRGFNDYDNWQASGVSGTGRALVLLSGAAAEVRRLPHAARAIRPIRPRRTARFDRTGSPRANTALPFVNHDPVQLKTVQDFLRDGQISVDVFGHRASSAGADTLDSLALSLSKAGWQDRHERRGWREPPFAVGEESASLRCRGGRDHHASAEVLAPLDKIPVTVRRGESVRVEVVVRTRKVGHFFPGGTVDAFDVWVELEAVDDKGRVLLHSGAAGGRRQRSRRSRRALLSQPPARRARQPDQQAQCLDDAFGRATCG